MAPFFLDWSGGVVEKCEWKREEIIVLDLDDLEACGFGSVSVEMGCSSCWLLGFLSLIWSAIAAGVLLLLLLSAKSGMIFVFCLSERGRGRMTVNFVEME